MSDESEVVQLVSQWVDPRLLGIIARRVRQGRDVYGPLEIDTDRRDYLGEAMEELADGLFYLGAACVQRVRQSDANGEIALLGRFVGVVFGQLHALRAWGR